MLGSADEAKMIWEMFAALGTLVVLSLFVYELFRGRKLAKTKQEAAQRWAAITRTRRAESTSEEPTSELEERWTAAE